MVIYIPNTLQNYKFFFIYANIFFVFRLFSCIGAIFFVTLHRKCNLQCYV